MVINKPTDSSLVWAHDLVRQLKLSNVSSRGIRTIMEKIPNKREIPLPNGKVAYLVSYDDFIEVAEGITGKKLSDFVRNVNNFKEEVKKDREELKRKREAFNREQALKEAREISKPVIQDTFYRKSLLIDKGFKEADCAGAIVKASIPGYQKIVSPKSSKAFFSNPEQFILERGFINSLAEEEQKRWIKNSKIKKPAFCFKNISIQFLRLMGLDTGEKEILKETKPKGLKIKKVRKEKELGKIGFCILNLLQLPIEEEESIEKEIVEQPIPKKQKIISFEEKKKQYASVEKKNKNIENKIYRFCQKLEERQIAEYSLSERNEFLKETKKYISALKIKQKLSLSDEFDDALLVLNQIKSNLENYTEEKQQIISKYTDFYLQNKKEDFERSENSKIIHYNRRKEIRNKILKKANQIASFTLIVAISIGSKGMGKTEKEDFGVKNMSIGISNTLENQMNSIQEEIKNFQKVEENNKIQNIASGTSGNVVKTNVLVNEVLENSETNDYVHIGEEGKLCDGARVFGTLEDLINNQNSKKPYYDVDSDIERTVKCIFVQNEEEQKKVYSNEEVDSYIEKGYEVFGYQIDNMYSYGDDGTYYGSEGNYKVESFTRILKID